MSVRRFSFAFLVMSEVIFAGFSITPEDLLARVKEYVSVATFTGWSNLGAAIGGLKSTDLRWANALELKKAVEDAFTQKFGAKEAAKPKGKVGCTQIIPAAGS